MFNEIPAVKQDTTTGTSTGPYDVVMYIAKSFGKSLPLVIVIALIAYGAWYAIREMASLQKALLVVERQKQEAEIKKAQAEADAKAAADRAKYEALLEYSKQLTELNVVAADISKRIQGLVSGQVDNMKKSEEMSKILSDKAREYQSQAEKESQTKLEELRTQIVEATKRANEQTVAATLSGYTDLRSNIASQLNKGYIVDVQVLELLRQKLDNSVVENQAIKDVSDSSNNWLVRVVIALELFKKTSNPEYIDRVRSLIEQNKRRVKEPTTSLFTSLFTRYSAFSDQQEPMLLPMLVDFILDEEFDSKVRNDLFGSPMIRSEYLVTTVRKEVAEKFIKYAGGLLVKTSSASDSWCYEVQNILATLEKLSQEAQLVYASRSLRMSGGTESEKDCIRAELGKAVSGRQLTDEMTQRWPVTSTFGDHTPGGSIAGDLPPALELPPPPVPPPRNGGNIP